MVDSVEHLDLIDGRAGGRRRRAAAVPRHRRVAADRPGAPRGTPLAPAHARASAWPSPPRSSRRPGMRLVGADVLRRADRRPARLLARRPQGQGEVARRADVATGAAPSSRRSVRSPTLEIVNGGGTGSLHVTGRDPALTELAAGSGLYGPTLFDGYRDFTPGRPPSSRCRWCAGRAPSTRPPSAAATSPRGRPGRLGCRRPCVAAAAAAARAPRAPARCRRRCAAGGASRAASRRPGLVPARQGRRDVRALRRPAPGARRRGRRDGADVPRRGEELRMTRERRPGNWSGIETWTPARVVTPATSPVSRQALAAARAATGSPSGPVGSGHSFTGAARRAGGVQLRLDRLARLLDVDRATRPGARRGRDAAAPAQPAARRARARAAEPRRHRPRRPSAARSAPAPTAPARTDRAGRPGRRRSSW